MKSPFSRQWEYSSWLMKMTTLCSSIILRQWIAVSTKIQVELVFLIFYPMRFDVRASGRRCRQSLVKRVDLWHNVCSLLSVVGRCPIELQRRRKTVLTKDNSYSRGNQQTLQTPLNRLHIFLINSPVEKICFSAVDHLSNCLCITSMKRFEGAHFNKKNSLFLFPFQQEKRQFDIWLLIF